jgi:hypothetical protein
MGCGCNKGRKNKGISSKKNNKTLTEKQKQILKKKRKLVSIQATSHPKIKKS